MSNQLVVPMFHQYTKIEELKRFIPAYFNRAILVVKEILDNACDEAEKTDYTVYIQFDRVNKRLTVKNKGIITEEALLKILDFSQRLTNKYLNKSYRRGAIGHGLKLAIMLSDIDNHPWIIKSNQKQFEITLKSRQAKEPKEVLSLVISEMPNNMINEVEITVPLFFGGNEEIDKMEDYIKNYIIANPHITFIYNNTKNSGIKVNKPRHYNLKMYTHQELKDLVELYISQGFDYSHVASLFGINNIRKRVISKFNVEEFIKFLNSNKKSLKPFSYGKKLLQRRIKVFKYKKISVHNTDFLEIVLSKELKDNIFCVNGSVVNSIYTFKDLNTIDLNSFLETMQKKRDIRCLLIYHSSNLKFSGTNKEKIVIHTTKVAEEIEKIYKSVKITDKNKDWILKKDELIEEANLRRIKKEEIELDYGRSIQTWRFIFLEKCKEIVEEMNKKYGAVTVRQVYYQLVSKGIISNSENSYSNLVNSLTDAREMGIIDYSAFEDRSRYIIIPKTVSINDSPKSKIIELILSNLITPSIDIWENQDHHVEIWIEKDALIKVFKKVSDQYQLNLYPSRGYSSTTKIQEAKNRFELQNKKGKKCIILYFGDLDPSGWSIYLDFKKKFKDLDYVKIERVALNKEHTEGLIPMPLKKTDSRYKNFLKEHGLEECYELDALDGDFLFKLATEAILKYLDREKIPDPSKWYKEYEEYKKKIESYINSL